MGDFYKIKYYDNYIKTVIADFNTERLIVGPIMDELLHVFSEDKKYIISKNNSLILFDFKGSQLKELNYSNVISWPHLQHKLAVVVKDKKLGLIDSNGNELLPCEYELISQRDTFKLRIKRDGIWGCYDVKSNNIITYGDVGKKYGSEILSNYSDKVYEVKERSTDFFLLYFALIYYLIGNLVEFYFSLQCIKEQGFISCIFQRGIWETIVDPLFWPLKFF